MMISEFFMNLVSGALVLCPTLALPGGFTAGISFLVNVVGFVNVFLPLARLAPIVAMIVLVRNWNIVVAVLRFVLRFIPFIG